MGVPNDVLRHAHISNSTICKENVPYTHTTSRRGSWYVPRRLYRRISDVRAAHLFRRARTEYVLSRCRRSAYGQRPTRHARSRTLYLHCDLASAATSTPKEVRILVLRSSIHKTFYFLETCRYQSAKAGCPPLFAFLHSSLVLYPVSIHGMPMPTNCLEFYGSRGSPLVAPLGNWYLVTSFVRSPLGCKFTLAVALAPLDERQEHLTAADGQQVRTKPHPGTAARGKGLDRQME